ncbi:MAG TPA: MFS transporter, partial [Gemmatimonadales bacterium]
GGTIGVVQAYVADVSTPEERTKSLGWLSAVTSLGAVAGPAFGSAMISLGGRTAPGLAAAALALLVAGFAARFLAESRTVRMSGSHAVASTTSPRQAISRVLSHWHEPASRLIWIYTISIGGRAAPGLAAAALALLVAGFAARFLVEPRQLRMTGSHAIPSTTSPRQAIKRVLSHWHEPASRLIWIYTIGIGAFYGTIQVVPLLLMNRLGVTERNIGYFIMYLGGMGVVVRSLLLGRVVDLLGEARLSRLGLVLLAAGLGCTGLAAHGGIVLLGFTLMPLGTAFLFPCVTGLLSRVVPGNERGLYMGVQHTFGGVSRVLFPVAAGLLMDRFGVGVPFWISGLLVLATLPFAWGLAESLPPESPATVAVRMVSSADVTGEFPVEKLAEERGAAGDANSTNPDI